METNGKNREIHFQYPDVLKDYSRRVQSQSSISNHKLPCPKMKSLWVLNSEQDLNLPGSDTCSRLQPTIVTCAVCKVGWDYNII